MLQILTTYALGVDVGSRTVKVAVLDDNQHLIKAYGLCHEGHVFPAIIEALNVIRNNLGDMQCTVGLTGAESLIVAHRSRLFYTNDETAVSHLVQKTMDDADMTIEIGAGGTHVYNMSGDSWNINEVINRATYLEYIAKLLHTNLSGLNKMAQAGNAVCAFSVQDGTIDADAVKAYLSEGVCAQDIAASLVKTIALHLQTVLGDAVLCGKIAFIGLAVEEMPTLRDAIVRAFALREEDVLRLPDAALCASCGVARLSHKQGYMTLTALIERFERIAKSEQVEKDITFETIELFTSRPKADALNEASTKTRMEKWRERLGNGKILDKQKIFHQQ